MTNPTFLGLEIAKRGLSAQQSALSVTANNISNANTEGYSRQRVTFKASTPYPSVSRDSVGLAGQMGTGVEIGSVERIRDSFLDYQYRTQNTKAGYYNAKVDAFNQMEGIMNELNDTGLNKVLNSFWNSIQELTNNAHEPSAASVVGQKGQAVAETFNTLYESLTTVQSNLGDQIDQNVMTINSLLSQLNSLNEQIAKVEPNGYLPNDLYDKRDQLLDELSSMVNIKVSYTKTGGNPLATAEGIASIEILDVNGQSLGKVLDGPNFTTETVKVNYDNDTGLVTGVSLGGTDIGIDSFTGKGSLLGLIESYGYMSNGEEKGLYPEMLADLDTMALAFAKEFNAVHQSGFTSSGEPGGIFFEFTGGEAEPAKGAAGKIKVADEIMNSKGDKIAASLNGEASDNANATNLANVFTKKIQIGDKTTTVLDYYAGIIGEMGVKAQETNRLAKNTETLVNTAELNRQSVSAVSLDEEMSNMIQFQHAYNAAARMITLQDEVLDKIINGMGVVGR
ncbi:flagellar hook-associated protein FlgK [Bacillus haynesii]|uniref:flagellar hook-associated protein FlgK n=1 Tax=Bacillus TaxID=1386 RepID=UPI0015940C8E|nr:flagellar hook-associated protein FlgK [Bacillus haynesii]NVB34659.1 flagellar hook-associated protein FlgK [Bacillus licheniformis]MCY7799362.1 flagellar hook-associated protein FlgK [Bacillus haynesii]MCY7838218.1 flagellar hook-associated protein FlgK [Bacillus haynesii]MCY7967264.1 flagellar hook-associated protein FlgK [Bacillus haynesii]MCY7992202.1 flagellar hook-associated protein FlgK [Bacillus haynesii]